jgi:hypothetical protein
MEMLAVELDVYNSDHQPDAGLLLLAFEELEALGFLERGEFKPGKKKRTTARSKIPAENGGSAGDDKVLPEEDLACRSLPDNAGHCQTPYDKQKEVNLKEVNKKEEKSTKVDGQESKPGPDKEIQTTPGQLPKTTGCAANDTAADCLPTTANVQGEEDTEPSGTPPPALPHAGQVKYGAKLVTKYGADSLDTANDLLRLLGYRGPARDLRREWGCLAAWWTGVKTESWSGCVIEQIKAKSFTKAEAVGRNGQVAMASKPKYLRAALDNLVKDFRKTRKDL